MLILEPKDDFSWKLKKDYVYKDIVVPNGYKTNGANIPRIFWSIYPPNWSNIMRAVVVHDYLCDNKEFKKADRYFKEILKISNISKFSVFVLHSAVTIYHYVRYRSRYV